MNIHLNCIYRVWNDGHAIKGKNVVKKKIVTNSLVTFYLNAVTPNMPLCHYSSCPLHFEMTFKTVLNKTRPTSRLAAPAQGGTWAVTEAAQKGISDLTCPSTNYDGQIMNTTIIWSEGVSSLPLRSILAFCLRPLAQTTPGLGVQLHTQSERVPAW